MLKFWVNKIYRFSKIHVTQGRQADVADLDNISKMPFYESFKQGLNFTLDRKLDQANKHFQQALNLLQQRKQQLNDHYLHIYRKLVGNQITLKRFQEAEENLYKLIKMKKRYNFQSVLLYDDYNALFQFFLKYNVQKAVLLGKALLTERQLDAMSLKHKKFFQFNLANAYFLVGNYADAKLKYSECLASDPDAELKSRVLNNLGLACWWHKNPLFDEKTIETQRNQEQIDSDYKQSRGLLLKAIETAENPQLVESQQQKYKLKQAVSEYELDISALFRRKESIRPIYNLAQYYINNEPNQKLKIIYWLRILLQLAQTNKHQTVYDEIFATLCLLTNDKNSLLTFLPIAIQKYAARPEAVYYNKLMAFFANGSTQHSKLLQRAAQLSTNCQKQDKYVFKRKYLSLYELVL